MSVLIKGMEMPKTCEECCLESFCNLWIEAIKMSGVELKVGARATIRHPDCPLVPVPEHGRCINADALDDILADQSEDEYNQTHAPRSWERALSAMRDYLKDAPTIIPAEEGEG